MFITNNWIEEHYPLIEESLLTALKQNPDIPTDKISFRKNVKTARFVYNEGVEHEDEKTLLIFSLDKYPVRLVDSN